jgi:hypothetical protein
MTEKEKWGTAPRNAVNANIISPTSATRHAAVGQTLRFYSKTGPDCQFLALASKFGFILAV